VFLRREPIQSIRGHRHEVVWEIGLQNGGELPDGEKGMLRGRDEGFGFLGSRGG
jgi:hypothetical protein